MASMMVNHLSQIIGQEEESSHQVSHTKQQVPATIQERVIPIIDGIIETPFTKEECWQALKKLGKEKSPGWDGITTEFSLEFWEDLASSCVALLNSTFTEGRLGDSIKKGLIKPIPKQVACSQLKHWKPITMLTTIYKLLAKMIATRMSPMLNSIVSQHQHGFIKGRSIYDNILTTMVGMEYAQFTKQECVLLQLDPDKAYDRIIW